MDLSTHVRIKLTLTIKKQQRFHHNFTHISFSVRVQASDPAQPFRGFVVQARESTASFTNEAAFVGMFVDAPEAGDWQIWECDAVRY